MMGSPGSGKTTVGRLVGQKLGLRTLDIDDDHLEPYWKMTVAEKLAEVGSDRFIEEEGKALLEFNAQNSVVSLTGSNPMHEESMSYVSKSGMVVFLDVENEDIVQRLERMKVNRIVGQGPGVTMSDILQYRQQFYEKSYDVRIIVEKNETQESISNKVVEVVKRTKNHKGYVSTRRIPNEEELKSMTFFDVVLKGLAQDGGLFIPAFKIPRFSLGELDRLVSMDYSDRALRVLEKWISPYDCHPSKLKEFIFKAYSNESFGSSLVFPVRHLEGNQYLCELFHGPTASFKDGAMQLMPQFFMEAIKSSERDIGNACKYLILVATSGDTGGAVLDGFSRHSGNSKIGVMVLYPEEGISEVQKKQMTSMAGDNIHVVGIRGDFDVCQSLVKRAFTDNILSMLLIQSTGADLFLRLCSTVSAYLELVRMGVVEMGSDVDLCVPTGNFGNILAAFYAKEMGVPFNQLICASNKLVHYDLRKRSLIQSFSPAMDILVSSNLERYIYHKSDSETVRHCFDSLIENRFFKLPKEVGYLLDPHTAVGKVVADKCQTKNRPVIIASTAHYEKFAPEVLRILGNDMGNAPVSDMFDKLSNICSKPAKHNNLRDVLSRPKVHQKVLEGDYKKVTGDIENFAKRI
ncbi:hypothetical protein KUTeg_020231 [Tegillarca granosa]|uniref:Threonine synthase N-terminal domain-containing protein n=1 Tax=Tegillarca granosa TaxID=220873 RepID=A0ABQ9E9X0_TEGGR|nr:hypothetical protein KUTeg_020231 [Tegillarca granosa]